MTHGQIVTSDITSQDAHVSTRLAYMCDATNGEITVTLSSKLPDGMEVLVKKVDSGLNDVLVEEENGALIDGEDCHVLELQWNSRVFFKVEGAWYVL